MALKMAQPWRDPKSHVWNLRQRTPADLVNRLKGKTVMLPVGEGFATVKVGAMVQASLRTSDPRTAKERHAIADAALRQFWERHRTGPKRLTHKEAAALAGTLYADFARIEDDPGIPELWISAAEGNMAARSGTSTLIIGDPALAASVARRDRFGAFADLLLAREGLVVDADSHELLLKAVQGAMENVTARLRKAADFDYTPDPAAQRFPEWQRSETAPKAPAGKLTVDDVFTAWTAFKADKLTPNTIKRYGASFRSLAAFVKGREVNALAPENIHGWAEHRRDSEAVSTGTINRVDLVAVSAVFKWATGMEGKRLMRANPAADLRLSEGRAVQKREKVFRAEEIKAVLRAALAAPPEPRNPTAGFAKRWCPWLAAYSGARISELTGLQGSDVRVEGNVPVMDFRKTKTGIARTVPLHEHIIAMGFLDFARSRGSGPLFYDPTRATGKAVTDLAEIRSGQLVKWLRKTVTLDEELQPNHGWRHTWKTRALEVDIQERISDAITGHATTRVSRKYQTPTVKMMADAMAKFPRYEVG
ncbi:DUF6538 domain-containing protein [Lichenibacterium ramalinae]|uniref:Integrase n=1 Tax=Lichenibacterium ramalinae TaxID=2316527 RepID=A0A4Q2RD18_9HYPH|nr:tyrosine-type recombinase/integrase [Lichenibacterium ramalinae]RYB03062.1 hypothetical protein D3272_18505 [Lichenibacterium ramalinae]